MKDSLGEMMLGIADSLRKLPDITTYCSLLVHEVMGMKSTEHFERVDSLFVSDGVVAKYRCNIDGRMYTVKVTADPK